MSRIENKLKTLGLSLPASNTPVGNYVPYSQVGSLVFVSGQTARVGSEVKYKGKVGKDLTVEEGAKAAEVCLLNVLCQLKAACKGELDMLKRVIKLNVYVQSTDDFTDHPKVANGASDLIVQLMGDHGKHARAAIGCNSLPSGSAVEIEGVFEIDITLSH